MDSTLHQILLSLHLLGVFLLLVGLSIEMVALVGLRRANSSTDLAKVMYAAPVVERITPLATILILGAGIWMALTGGNDYSWHSAWIITAFAAVIAFAVNGGAIVGKKLEHIGKTAAQSEGGGLTPELAAACQDTWLHYSSWASIGGLFSLIWLMVGKPGWAGSIITLFIGVVAGLLAARVIKLQAAAK